MMQAYYDIGMKDRFQDLFGNLWIGSHPTEYQGIFRYYTLIFQIGGDITELKENFNTYCNDCIDNL